jgi:AraC-like DNA-binding protein
MAGLSPGSGVGASSETLPILPVLPFHPVNFLDLFEHLNDVYFYIKDTNSVWLGCNSATLTLFNAARKSEIIGKTDWDFYPEQIAREIVEDDRHVVETGRSIVNKFEVIVDEFFRLVWVTTTKMPAHGEDGRICGLMGLTRIMDTTGMLPPGAGRFSEVIEHIERNYRGSLEVSQLARIACLSESQFRKRFVKLFKMSPQKFITRIRIQTAAKLLAGGAAPIAEVALLCGFCDQSYFTRQFSSFFGTSPKKYRDRWSVSVSGVGIRTAPRPDTARKCHPN